MMGWTMRTGAEVMADHLAAWDLGPVFHVPGEGLLDLLEALATRHPAVRLVTARHEGGMAFMASGAARVTGRPAVCLAARAPGALNICLALHTAMTDAVPLLLVIGQAPMSTYGREGFLDEDFVRVFAPLAKWVGLITEPGRIPEAMSRAVHVAMSGRHGPVVLILPEDVGAASVAVRDLAYPRFPEPAPDARSMAAVAAHLEQARRPLVILGGSDWDQPACDRMRAVAGRLDLPVAVAYRRRDLFDNADPCFVGEIGIGIAPELARRVAESDLLLVIGARLGELNTIGGAFHGFSLLQAPRPAQKLIHVHADAAELNRVYQADLAIQATPAAFLAGLERLELSPGWSEWRRGARRQWDAYGAPPLACPDPVDLAAIHLWLRAFLPEDTGIAVGAGAYALWAQRFFPHARLGTLLGPKSGAMGYGLPAAIGAAIACPERRFVALAGDGCFMMHAEELATAIRERVAVVTIVFNNAAYGAIRLTQFRRFGRAVGTGLANPDFAAFARSFGAHGERVVCTEDFAPAFARAFAAAGPAVVEVIVPEDATRPPP
jgi:acetolactate synthase-1/2/3 large subunit